MVKTVDGFETLQQDCTGVQTGVWGNLGLNCPESYLRLGLLLALVRYSK
jgi:hypothetical protein